MDSVIFQAMAAELDRKLGNSRVERILQVSAGTLVLKLWTGREKRQLLLQADGRGCFYQTRATHAAPAHPPRFCQLLRARLRRLLAVRAEPLDRIAHFQFSGANQENYDLVLEGCSAQGNLILVDTAGAIVDLLRRQSDRRLLLPGHPYHLPEQKPRLWLLDDPGRLAELIGRAGNPEAIARLDIAPMSPALAQAIWQAEATGMELPAIVARLQDTYRRRAFEGLRVTWDGGSGLLPLQLGMSAFRTVQRFVDLSQMLEETSSAAGRETVPDLRIRLAAVVARQRKKLQKRLARIVADQACQSDPERLRICGDLILANLQQIRRGADAVEVEDYYRTPPAKTTISLQARLSPQENAERYFKLYRKAKRAGDHHRRRIRETEQELAWLDQVELDLDEAAAGIDLYQVQLELAAVGLLKETKGQLARRPTPVLAEQLHRTETPGGLKILWGKNSHTNDYVSRRLTAANDLWFHAQALPGCHLVLKCGDVAGQVPEEDILYAAALAAGYSRGRDAGKVEVIVAPGRAVRKVKGARPGLVTVDSYRTVMVAPRRLDD